MTASSRQVFCFSGSPFVWRVLLTLAEKGIAHEQTWIPRASWEQKRGELLDRNPRGRLPVMIWDGVPLYESLAICMFLELEQPEPRLVPADAAGRARALVLAQEAENYAVPPAMSAIDELLFRAPGIAIGEADRARNRVLHEELARWNHYLAGGATYLVGDRFTLADVSLFPMVAFLVRCGLQLESELPHLAAWYARIAPRPSVQASWPPHWRESPGRDIGLNER